MTRTNKRRPIKSHKEFLENPNFRVRKEGTKRQKLYRQVETEADKDIRSYDYTKATDIINDWKAG